MNSNHPTPRKRPGSSNGMRVLDDSILDGFNIKDIKCRSCSGYGNCGYKQYFLNPDGAGVVSICMMTRRKMQCERDGEEFSLDKI